MLPGLVSRPKPLGNIFGRNVKWKASDKGSVLTPWVESGSPSGAPLRGLEVRLVLELPKAPGSRQAALVVYACEVNQENIGKQRKTIFTASHDKLLESC